VSCAPAGEGVDEDARIRDVAQIDNGYTCRRHRRRVGAKQQQQSDDGKTGGGMMVADALKWAH